MIDSSRHSSFLAAALAVAVHAGCGSAPERRAPAPRPWDPGAPFALPALQETVEEYRLEMPPETLRGFLADPELPEQPARFSSGGVSYPALVRIRGNSSRLWPKKSWRVELPEGARFDGRRKLNLLSEYKDATFMVEKLAYDLLAAMNVPVPRAKYVRLVIDGVYQGVYLDLERVDGSFLRNHGFPDEDATIYRCGRKDCEMKTWRAPFQGNWDKKTNELTKLGRAELEQVLWTISRSPEPTLETALSRALDLEMHLRVMAVDALASNNVVEDSRSYFIYDAAVGGWFYVPWDYNNSTARFLQGNRVGSIPSFDHPLVAFSRADGWVEAKYQERATLRPEVPWHPIFSNLNTRIAFNPALRERLLAVLERALDELFTPEVLAPRIAATRALLAPHVADDPYVFPGKFADAERYMNDYVRLRSRFLRDEIARLRAWKPPLVLAALDPDAGWVELENRTGAHLSTSGLAVTTNLRSVSAPNVPSRTLAPSERVRFTGRDLGLSFAPAGEVGLFEAAASVRPLDVLYYGEIASSSYYARSDADPARWEIRAVGSRFR